MRQDVSHCDDLWPITRSFRVKQLGADSADGIDGHFQSMTDCIPDENIVEAAALQVCVEHSKVFRLLGAERIGLSLSGGHAVEPEQSTVAIVAHHPQAVYFGMKSGFIPKDKAPDEIIKGTEKDPSRVGAAAG